MTRSMIKPLMIAAAVAFAAPTIASAQQAFSTPDYLAAATRADQFELQSAELALHADADVVVHFAQRVIRDHERTAHALGDAEARSGLPQPDPSLDTDQLAMLNDLANKRAGPFDHTYINQQIAALDRQIEMNRAYAKYGDDQNVREAAQAVLALVQDERNALTTINHTNGNGGLGE